MSHAALPFRLAPGLALAAFSAAMILGALGFEYIGGLAPCVLCMDQRYAHGAAIALGLVALVLGGGTASGGAFGRAALALGLVALLVGAGIAVFHVGVEQHWWQGTAACGSALAAPTDIAGLIAQIEKAPIVRCDEVAWAMLGISMAGWNAIASVAAAIVIALAAEWRGAPAPSGRLAEAGRR
jgi:disulfide bond formation protein DsbB